MTTLANKTRIKGVATGFRKVRAEEGTEEYEDWLEFVTTTAQFMSETHRASFVEACKNDAWVDVT